MTAGIYNAGDVVIVNNKGISGHFVLKSRSSKMDNGEPVITIYAQRRFNSEVHVEWFGADKTGAKVISAFSGERGGVPDRNCSFDDSIQSAPLKLYRINKKE